MNVLDLITLDDENIEFKKRSNMKMWDMFKVTKKGVVVKKVTNYCLVDDFLLLSM